MHGVWKREKVSFNIASEASYVYKIDQKCIKNAKNGQTVLPDGLISRGQKLVEKSQNKKIEMRHFESFSNNVWK